MKKALMLLLGLLVLLAGTAYAEVQNVRVTGEVRMRGYLNTEKDLTKDEADVPRWPVFREVVTNQVPATETVPAHEEYTTNMIPQSADDKNDEFRTRVRLGVEADLTDQVLAAATFQGKGQWGNTNDTWDMDVAEAYVQMEEMFYSPMTLKVGRQSLHYGRGLIFSSKEGEYSFDTIRLVADMKPTTMDLVVGRLAERGPGESDDNLLWLNVGYSFEKAAVKDIEAYAGYRTGYQEEGEPGIIGMRSTLLPMENWDLWGEFGYEFGKAVTRENLSAFVLDLGTQFVFADLALEPSIKLGWTWATGDDDPQSLKKNFIEWFDYNYWGLLMKPRLSNVHIFNLGTEIIPAENFSIGLDFYYYMQDKALAASVGSPIKDNGGITVLTNGDNKNLGSEIDLSFGYDYSADVSSELAFAVFMPGSAYSDTTGKDQAIEVRGEILVNF